MEFELFRKLVGYNENDEYFELESGSNIMLYLNNGDSMAVQVDDVREDSLVVADEENELSVIPFDDIKNIEEA